MMLLTATALAALAISNVEAYPEFFNGMTWANFAWEVNPKQEDLQAKDMVLVDMFDTSRDTINDIRGQASNVKIVCYLSAGTWESWRPDASHFPAELKEENYYSGSDREKWLDITQWSQLKSIMSSRFQTAKDKGCDGLELDNQDCYVNGGDCMKGPSYETLKTKQIEYAKWLASEAHNKNMAVGLKNAMELMDQLQSSYDFAVNEECAQYGECDLYTAFTGQGKAVFGVEYNGESHCDDAEKQGISRKYKTSSGAWEDCDWMYEAREARINKQEAPAEEQSSGASAGVVIGGVLAGVACVALVAGGGTYMYKKRKGSGESLTYLIESSTSMGAVNNA